MAVRTDGYRRKIFPRYRAIFHRRFWEQLGSSRILKPQLNFSYRDPMVSGYYMTPRYIQTRCKQQLCRNYRVSFRLQILAPVFPVSSKKRTTGKTKTVNVAAVLPVDLYRVFFSIFSDNTFSTATGTIADRECPLKKEKRRSVNRLHSWLLTLD